jgi:hypothetical protein
VDVRGRLGGDADAGWRGQQRDQSEGAATRRFTTNERCIPATTLADEPFGAVDRA